MTGLLVLVILTVAIICHLCLRHLYGRRHVAWVYFEYVWLALSFVGLLLAVVQLQDKTLAIETDQVETTLIYDIDGVKWLAGKITTEMDNPEVINRVAAGAAPMKFEMSVLPAMKSLSNRPFPLFPAEVATLYDDHFKSFCEAYFGDKAGEVGSFQHYMAASSQHLTAAENVRLQLRSVLHQCRRNFCAWQARGGPHGRQTTLSSCILVVGSMELLPRRGDCSEGRQGIQRPSAA